MTDPRDNAGFHTNGAAEAATDVEVRTEPETVEPAQKPAKDAE